MSYPINYPTPQNCNVQTFYGGQVTTGAARDWVKPQGATMIWFTVIGSGTAGQGGGYPGGDSGAVTNCLMPAFLVPDQLRIIVGRNGVSSAVVYQQKAGTAYILLLAGLAAQPAGAFAAAGLYQSIAGQIGTAAGATSSATTFLSAGFGSGGTGNYGYAGATNGNAQFRMQPIISSTPASGTGRPDIGCGAGNTYTTSGGDGMVIIISW